MFDYTNIDFSIFEKIAKYYLESRFPEYKWEATPPSGDGNKDIICKYKVLSQEFEYWAEAKFSQTGTKTLSKGQLDPTLVSALIYSKPVSVCFISNNNVSDSYLYRLKDFKLKTNIGVELVLKDAFENWLQQNPDIIDKYNIKKVPNTQSLHQIDTIEIHSAIISNKYNNQYKFEKFLKDGNRYYLYLIINSIQDIENVRLDINDGFIFTSSSNLLDNYDNFLLKQGKHVYKFEIMPCFVGKTNLNILIKKQGNELATLLIKDITITYNNDIALSYASQERALLEIKHFVNNTKLYNHAIAIVGDGSMGKTALLEQLSEELISDNNILFVSFIGNEYYDLKIFYKILLFFNMGDIFDYDKNMIISQLDLLSNEEYKIYLTNLIDVFYGSNGANYTYLIQKSMSENFCLLYPSHNDVTQVVIIDDMHKLNGKLSNLFKKIIIQFNELQNNQIIIIGSRENYKEYSFNLLFSKNDYIQRYLLNGLSKEDKQNNTRYYLECNKNINFDRSTDDLIVFSNILQDNIKNFKNLTDNITKTVLVSRAFENPKVVSSYLYKQRLNSVESYNNLIECVYLIGFGIDYNVLEQTFPAEDIDFLINNRFFKRVSNKVLPFHDYYVKAFFEERIIANNTVDFIQKICSLIDNQEEKYMYYALLINSNYSTYCKIEKEAHELQKLYFTKTDYYKSYILSKAFIKYINFDETLSVTELYDLFILAVSSGYFEEPFKVKSLYKKVIKYSGYYTSNSDINGIILSSQSELVNIDYWELDVTSELDTINQIVNKFKWIEKNNSNNLIIGYLNLLNRKMVIKLLFEQFDEAQELYKENINEIERLDRIEYLGYLYMDYAKGLYIKDLDKAVEYMEKAYVIFQSLNTEFRRLLDCKCELAYLKCLKNPKCNFVELENAAEELYNAQFWEIYCKAKLKLAALKMIHGEYTTKEIEHDLYISEYVLNYPLSGRLKILHTMVKNAFYVFSNNLHNRIEISIDDKHKINKIGGKLKVIYEHNKKGFKKDIKFYTNTFTGELNIYLLDPRIW